MRLYELAKQYNVSSKDLLLKLRNSGFEVSSHMAVLSDKEIEFLQQLYSSQKKSQEKASKKAVQSIVAESVPDKKESTNMIESLSVSKAHPQKERTILTVSKDSLLEKKVAADEPLELKISSMTLSQLAEKINKPVNELIVLLLKKGIVTTKNQLISEPGLEAVAQQYNITLIKPVKGAEVAAQKSQELTKGAVAHQGVERAPVFVVIGHVDHGKTTLLDYVRNTRVAAKEKGGITQHIGAYEVHTGHGDLVFIDTPGHEAFGKLRQRGIKVADIAILIVAADDGVMPQTVEAIRQAKIGQLPLVVAINKVDKADQASIDRVKQQLSQYGILVEEWGGDIICVPISAKTGAGVDQLLEMLVLQAQMMDLRAEVSLPGRGYVLESRLEKGRGAVATVISHDGSIAMGDYFSCGNTTGRVTALVDSYGAAVKKVGPSVPARISGFEEMPEVGDIFEVVSKDEYKKCKILLKKGSSVSADVGKRFSVESALNIVLKADTHSSLEALIDAVEKVSAQLKKGVSIVFSGIGDVSESDIDIAATTNAMIMTFNVKVEPKVASYAQGRTEIKSFDIIYRLLEFLHERLAEPVEAEVVLKKVGEAVVLKVFDIKNVGVIAGSQVKEGVFTRKALVKVWRNGKKVGEGRINSLQRDKKVVKEVTAGYECGFVVDGFKDWEVGDKVECFSEQ